MSSYIQVIDFMPKDTLLLVAVSMPDNLSDELKNRLRQYREEFNNALWTKKKYPVPLYLKETSRIQFSISQKWKIKKELEECICDTLKKLKTHTKSD